MTGGAATDPPAPGEADWEQPPRRPPADAAPVLAAEGFEGPIDWIVEQVRAGRIDLARLPVAALVGAFADALETVLDGADAHQATLARWSAWLVLAAELALLRSRLLVPGDEAVPSALDAAEALRRQVQQRAGISAAADWLDRHARLGREVWGRGAPGIQTAAGRTGDVTGLLRACLVALRVPDEVAAAFRVRLPFWSMADATGRILELLPGVGEDGAVLERFLPEVRAGAPGYAVRCRAAVAATFAGALELSRQGAAGLRQDVAWAAIRVERPASIQE